MTKELKQIGLVLADIKIPLFLWDLPILRVGVGSADPIHPKLDKVMQEKQSLFSEFRHLVISNYLDWVNGPKHFIKQYFILLKYLFLSYYICCFSTTTLILKCFSWNCASHGRNKLVESSHMPITITGLLYTHWNVWFTGISHHSSYHQAAKTSWFVCAKTIQGLCS